MCVHACVCAQRSCPSRLLWSVSFFYGRGLRVLTLSDPGRLSARAALFPEGELEHALRPHFAVQHRCRAEWVPSTASCHPTGKVRRLRDSLLWSLWSPTHRVGADSWCQLNQTAPGRSRTCLLTQAEAETVRLRVKPLPLRTTPALVRFAGVVQSSRLAPFGPRDRCLASAILEIAAGWAFGKTHCFKISPPRKSALQAPTLGLRDDGKSNLQFFPFYLELTQLFASSAVPEPSVLTPQVPFA